MEYLPTDAKEMLRIIMSFRNKVPNLVTVSPFIFKGVAIPISPLSSDIIDESFTEGVLPIARVILLFKSSQGDDVSNHRPISTLSYVSKVFKRAKYCRLLFYCVI